MKKYLYYLTIKIKNNLFIFLLLLCSCNTKKETSIAVSTNNNLHLLFSTFITDNGHDKKYNSRIAFNDTVFVISEFGMAHTEYMAVDSNTYVWIRGKTAENKLAFKDVVEKYKLNQLDFNKFTSLQNDTLLLGGHRLDSIEYYHLTARKSNNGNLLAYYKLKGDSSLIDLFIKNKNYTFHLPPNKWIEPSFELLDITGDGIDEIFVLNFGPAYWGGSGILKYIKFNQFFIICDFIADTKWIKRVADS